ncbi:phosphate ABC transporter permease subunit PstC [Sulfurospirillum sp. 1612]|uniref:phosphate ABC transporter permease subunit PstC n=1 Tax=Sulfurospirillum sp. 1612 TaxID=3094835 RepID=UPI002F9240DE
MSATLILVLLVSIFVMLFISAKPAMQAYGWHFLVDSSWGKTVEVTSSKPVMQPIATSPDNSDADSNLFADEETPILPISDQSIDPTNQMSPTITKTIYGGFVPIVGTILSTLIAMAFAMPIAMGIAIFLSEIAPKFLIKPVGLAIELLAAIPSIIYGMWGLFYFAPIVQKIFGGYQISILTAGLVLGIMILPFMAAITRDAMNTTPSVLKESAYSLGATKFEVVKDIIFPYAKVGIIGSIILSLGRALGETMAVAFLIGSVFKVPNSLTSPTISIPVVLANNFGEASGDMMSALFYLAFILFVFSFIIIGIAKFYFLRRHR